MKGIKSCTECRHVESCGASFDVIAATIDAEVFDGDFIEKLNALMARHCTEREKA